jgi:two-component system alkaline phosphatase synthesis response regulator PhoP
MPRKKRSTDPIQLNGLTLTPENQQVHAQGKSHRLTPMECKLLGFFMRHPGEVLTRELLMNEVWETSFTDDMRTIEVHVSWLRKKIEEDPRNPRHIRTVWGVGYVFGKE